MNKKISEIADRIAELEQQLERALTEELEAKRRKVLYVIERGRAAFTAEARALRQTARQGAWAFLWEAPVKTLLVAPVIPSLSLWFCWICGCPCTRQSVFRCMESAGSCGRGISCWIGGSFGI